MAIGGLTFVMFTITALAGWLTMPHPLSAAPPAPVGAAAVAPHLHGDATSADGASAHEESQGFVLHAAPAAAVEPAACVAGAAVRAYEVSAIAVDITYNRYLDHDPQGRMYVLDEDVSRVRAEEAQNAKARANAAEPAVSIGLQGDAIQPLTLRVDQGECLRIQLRDRLTDDQPVGLRIHGAGEYLTGALTPVIDANAAAYATPDHEVVYEWMVGTAEPTGTHYFNSPGDDRSATSHGLFGAVIVEPRGSTHLDPTTGRTITSGWQSVIRGRDGVSFREAVLYYHEVGDELYQLLNKEGAFVPLVDPLTTAYRPAARALNYRSEPFMNRLQLQVSLTGTFDESAAYSSYVFGDPATPMIRSYLADPLTQRLVHGGSEVFHVHHVHGGSIRWSRQSGVEPVVSTGLDKHPRLLPTASERTDAQSVGPSETFDIEDECGSGGCQQSAGDYLIHCHVAQHYFAGMWSLWRVYNTSQDGSASTDTLAPLLELPDRQGKVRPAVGAAALVGHTVDWYGKKTSIDAAGLGAWVAQQLPPPGVPKGYDAAVWDWRRDGDRFLGEMEDTHSWPGYVSPAPDTRPELRFDPLTGKLAYPFLRPHLAKRPPFAPGHGPAPYLDPLTNGVDVPAPGANGPGSVCPEGTHVQAFSFNALHVPVVLNKKDGLVDPAGELYVLRENVERTRADADARVPLAIRANAGEDCVDVTLRSEIEDSPNVRGISKVDVHIHFVQFDVQASDGVDAGFNYEQSVRPFAAEGERLTTPIVAGDTRLALGAAARFQIGELIGVGMERDATFEVARIAGIEGSALVVDRPLRFAHAGNEIVSTEFVRYRWYPDAQFGTAYFHDHVNGIDGWRHGLFGALIAEPPGSTYHDPKTGAAVRSGAIADVHTSAKVSVDLTGSFRELALFVQDDNPITHLGRSTGSSFNLRAEPLDGRGPDAAHAFDSRAAGDPVTPILDAFIGDPVVVRVLVPGTNDVHTWHVDGHTFRIEPFSGRSPPVSTVHLGISERYDLTIPAAGGPRRMAGDYLFYNGRAFKLAEGSWGLLRVRDPANRTGLQPLPDRAPVASGIEVCPAGAPEKRFAVDAVEARLPMLAGTTGRVFVLKDDVAAVASGTRAAEPLVLHVNVGDCIRVDLTNALPSGGVSFHVDTLPFDPRASGIPIGRDATEPLGPGAKGTFMFFADPSIGETTALVRDFADVMKNPRLGLYGAIVVGPAGATYTDPATGADSGAKASWRVDVQPVGAPAYRDFSLFFQDEDAGIGTHRMPYTQAVDGIVGLSYRLEPLKERPPGAARFDLALHPPNTPTLEAVVGDPVRIHVLAPYSEQSQVFGVEGHRWAQEPGTAGTNLLSAVQVGGAEAISVQLDGGAGGATRLAGDYTYGDLRLPYRDAGLWGMFRVYRCVPDGVRLGALNGRTGACAGVGASGATAGLALGGVLLAIAVIVGALGLRRVRAARMRGRSRSAN
ncbi:MAG TPA: hypothetical protein VHG53_07035 [Candidatus Limnocylindria bacterium]|nr:hypothetical protein [Candidatus Limnocylindria bacterium]